MKQAIIGLAALVAGCAAPARDMPTYMTAARHPVNAQPVAEQPGTIIPDPIRVDDVETGFSGCMEADAPACNNTPYVRFKQNGYRIICGNYEFNYLEKYGNETIRHMERNQVPFGLERWYDQNNDQIIDEWELFVINSSMGRSFTSSRIPPSANDQIAYENALVYMGRKGIHSQWEEWKQNGGN